VQKWKDKDEFSFGHDELQWLYQFPGTGKHERREGKEKKGKKDVDKDG